jgi:hypothetical protein
MTLETILFIALIAILTSLFTSMLTVYLLYIKFKKPILLINELKQIGKDVANKLSLLSS